MQFELRHLRAFLAVADELNFTRAAERLHVAQPALSAQIRQLETQLGCELFVRTTRKVELSPQGALLLDDARAIVERADAAAAKLTAAARGEQGIVRVGFVAQGAGEPGLEILRRFAAEHPQFSTEFVESGSLDETQRLVVENAADVAFVWKPVLYGELESMRIRTERKLVALRADHRLATAAEITPSELYDEPIVAPWDALPQAMADFWLGPFRPDGRLPGDPNANGLDECLAHVGTGAAVFCVPASVGRFYVRPDVVYRPIADVEPAEIALVWRRDAQHAGIRQFVEVAREVVSETPQAI
jgi:DNA-binding transcriptional LysR family regulator